MYATSIADPDAFWHEHGKRIDWIKPFSITKNVSYAHPDVSIKWFELDRRKRAECYHFYRQRTPIVTNDIFKDTVIANVTAHLTLSNRVITKSLPHTRKRSLLP